MQSRCNLVQPRNDPFLDDRGQPRVVRGVTINSNATRLAELAGLIGFETAWIDVEHGTVGFAEIEALSTAIEAGGAVPTVRIPDHQRHHVLRTVEAGGRIVVVPMIDCAEDARRIVEHGKFPPLGRRGFNQRSRGLRYGLEPPAVSFPQANERTHFFPQIETVEAARNVEAIAGVEGIAGIFIGPGDLSASLGKPGAFTDPEVISTVTGAIRRARALSKHAGILAMPGPLLLASIDAGADLIFAGSDITNVTAAWKALLEALPARPASPSRKP
jgi:4-hydroxy-2-oxoheptanedioate aldolase